MHDAVNIINNFSVKKILIRNNVFLIAFIKSLVNKWQFSLFSKYLVLLIFNCKYWSDSNGVRAETGGLKVSIANTIFLPLKQNI